VCVCVCVCVCGCVCSREITAKEGLYVCVHVQRDMIGAQQVHRRGKLQGNRAFHCEILISENHSRFDLKRGEHANGVAHKCGVQFYK
jgi:hypothetical protein